MNSIANQDPNSYAGQVRKLRADTQALADKSASVGTEFGTLQKTAYDSYNQCHSVYDSAENASSDDGNTDNSGNGAAMNAGLPGLNANQATLQASSTSAVSDVAFCQSEIGRLSGVVTSLAASAPQGPVAAALQQALSQLGEAGNQQGAVQFNDSDTLSQTQALLVSVTGEAAAVAADAAGVDVSASARGAMNDLQSAQNLYEQVAMGAEQGGIKQLPVSESCRQAVASIDQALEALDPEGQPEN